VESIGVPLVVTLNGRRYIFTCDGNDALSVSIEYAVIGSSDAVCAVIR
jgi:hypothetical protein